MAGIKKLKAAVIGCGRIGAFTTHKKGDGIALSNFPINHCAAIRATPGIELIAVCDANPEAAEKAAKLHKTKNTYTDFKQMIREQSPDIVAIATRMAGRKEIIEFAAKNGVKALHIEKPLANNLKDTKEILKIINRYKIAISYGTVRRYTPVYRQAKQILKSGKLGKLKEIIVDFSRSQLFWTHPHSIDLINFFTDNQPADHIECSFDFDPEDFKNGRLDLDPVLNFGKIHFQNEISANITDKDGQHVKLICEGGEIRILESGKYLKVKDKEGKTKNIKIKKGVSGRCTAIIELRDGILKQKPATFTTKELLNEQQILLTLGLAGITGKKTKLSDIKDSFTITGKFNNLYP